VNVPLHTGFERGVDRAGTAFEPPAGGEHDHDEDRDSDHDRPLDGVGEDVRIRAARRQVQQQKAAGNPDADAVFEPENRLEDEPSSRDLCHDIEEEEQSDRRGEHPDRRALKAIAQEVRHGLGAEAIADLLRDPCDQQHPEIDADRVDHRVIPGLEPDRVAERGNPQKSRTARNRRCVGKRQREEAEATPRRRVVVLGVRPPVADISQAGDQNDVPEQKAPAPGNDGFVGRHYSLSPSGRSPVPCRLELRASI